MLKLLKIISFHHHWTESACSLITQYQSDAQSQQICLCQLIAWPLKYRIRGMFQLNTKLTFFIYRYPGVYGPWDVRGEVWWVGRCLCLWDVYAGDGYLRVPLLWMSECCPNLQEGNQCKSSSSLQSLDIYVVHVKTAALFVPDPLSPLSDCLCHTSCTCLLTALISLAWAAGDFVTWRFFFFCSDYSLALCLFSSPYCFNFVRWQNTCVPLVRISKSVMSQNLCSHRSCFGRHPSCSSLAIYFVNSDKSQTFLSLLLY